MMGPMAGHILFLGSDGRVGRMLRQVLSCPPQDLAEFARRPLIWQARAPRAGAATLCWSPGTPLPEGLRAGVIVALWGVTSGTPKELANNTFLAQTTLDIARRTGARRVLHMSSAAVYGAPAFAVSEATAPQPRTPYGLAKLAMERAIFQAHPNVSGPRNTLLRLGNVAGADALFSKLTGPVTLDRFADGQGPSRSYIAPRDLARVIARLATCPLSQLPEVLNVAGPHPVAMADIARAAGVAMTWRAAPPGALARMTLATDGLSALGLHLPDSSDPARLVAQWRTYTADIAPLHRIAG